MSQNPTPTSQQNQPQYYSTPPPVQPNSTAPQQTAPGRTINQQNVHFFNYSAQSNPTSINSQGVPVPQPGYPQYYYAPHPGHPPSYAPPPVQPTSSTPQPGHQPSSTPQQPSTGRNMHQQNFHYNFGTQSNYQAPQNQQNFQTYYNYPPGHYQHVGPGHPPQQTPPASGYAPQPPAAGYKPPPGGYFSPPQPAQHVGNVFQVPAQNLQAKMMMNNVHNYGCTVNNVGSIGSQTTYNINNSTVGHVGPKITKNITIQNLSVGMGVKKEEIETFTNLLGDDAKNDEYLQTFTTLMHEHDFQLPSVSAMMRSTCLIQHLGPHGGKWHGTAFLSTLPRFEGLALLSAGHNFEDEGSLLKDFESFHLLFNNEHGLNASSLKTVKDNSVIDFNLTTFMSKFSYTSLVLTCKGKQLIQRGTEPPTEKPHQNTKLDYFVLLLHGPEARQKINELGLDYVEAASMKDLEKSGEPVFIFGYPGMKEQFCVCCKKLSKTKDCNCGPSTPPCPCYPARTPCQHKSCSCQHKLRFSYAKSKKQNLFKDKEHMEYELDTLSGMSGSVITGAKYKAKGIHIIGASPYNKAQTLITLMKDILKLDILKTVVAEKCEVPLENLKLNDVDQIPPSEARHQDISPNDDLKKDEDCKVQ